jgi:hypothetical protein
MKIALAAATILVAGRVVQLAALDSPPIQGGARGGFVETATSSKTESTDPNVAALYAACPMARVIDLATVASDPQKVEALLPPYSPTVHRVPVTPVEPAIPRIRYPVAVRTSSPAPAEQDDTVRVAEKPAKAVSGEPSPSPVRQSSPQASLKGRGKDWLIDPDEWFTPEERGSAAKQQEATAQPGTTDKPAVAPPGTRAPNESAGGTESTSSPPPVAPQSKPVDSAPPVPSETPTEPSKPIFSPPPAPGELPAAHGSDRGDKGPGGPQDGPPEAAPPEAGSLQGAQQAQLKPGVDPHLELFTKNNYPSARECAQCHEEIYKDWAISAHAYAAVSPMFHKFEQKMNDLSSGTVGYFCMRCHAPVATSLGASRAEPLWNLPEVAREGITCIACHRVQYVYGKSNGERRIETGPIFAPVFGGIDGDGVAEAIHRKNELKLKTSPDETGPGQNIHVAGIFFEPLTRSEFCTPCHQVAVQPGIKLEVVWEQYRASPACKKGIQCQDCHMGRIPGLPLGYDCGPVAKIGDKTVNDNRKKSNHVFYGPNYPIAHPGVFPFNLKANRWTMDQWLLFDWRAGWGTKEFENAVASGQIHPCFPPVWAEADDRYDAREIIDANLKGIERKRDIRVQVMENGSHVDGPFFDSSLCRGQDLNFHYVVKNTNEGHNLLTASLGAQPQLWANVVLIGPDGTRLWESGYTDSFNDVANIHSEDVRWKRVPYDFQLFNLQTMFLIQGATGTDREFYVPVNIDTDQLPFIRPGVQPIPNINHPPGIRMESHSLPPLGSREARYHIPGQFIQQPGTYRLSFRLRSRSEPMYFMRFCGATEEMMRAENEWMIDVHPMTVEFVVH